MIEDDLQSNMSFLVRATQLSKKSATQKKMRWSEGQVSVACQGGKRVVGESPTEE